jgi:carbonic anhydrase/acetyltransferase-like protein (isoleucine patch superfamily)
MGAPGQIKREVSDEHIARIRHAAEHYVANWQRYKRDLRAG